MCAATILCRVDQVNDMLSGATIVADGGPLLYAVDECASSRLPSDREWGGRWLMSITCYMVRPNGALHVLASVNNGASLTDGNSVTPVQVS